MKRRDFVRTLSATGVALYASDLVGDLIAQSPKDGFSLMGPILLIGFAVALLHAFLLALPVYWAARRWWRLAWWNSMIAGCAVGVVPATFLLGLNLDVLYIAAACGLAGGLVFWIVLRGGLDDDDADDHRRTFA